MVGSLSDDPDDLVQDAVARTLAKTRLAGLDNPGAYLRRAISNLVINEARSDNTRRNRAHMLGSDDEWHDRYPSDLNVLESLTPIERAVLFLVDVEGRPFAEAAEFIGCTPVAARLRASRGRRRLRRILEEET